MSSNSNSNSNSSSEVIAPVDPEIGSVIIMAFIILLSLFFNMFVCIMVTYFRRLRLATSAFVVNLCIADILITLFGMSIWMWMKIEGQQAEVVQHEKILVLWQTLDILCGTLCITSLAAISLDKCLAVSRPLTYETEVTNSRKAKVVIFLWIYSIISSSIFWTKLRKEFLPYLPYIIISLSFFIPLIIILLSYAKIYMIAKLQVQMLNTQCGNRKINEIKAAKTISIVIGSFCLCWAPFFVITILYTEGVEVHALMVDVSKWLTYVNAFLNPLVYTLLDRRFRKLLLSKMAKCYGRDSLNTSTTGKTAETDEEIMLTANINNNKFKECDKKENLQKEVNA